MNIKRIFSGIVAVVMLCVLSTTVAFAETNTVEVATEAELISALATVESGDTIRLTADIELTATLQVNREGTFTIDGDGNSFLQADSFTNPDTAIMFGFSTWGDAEVATHNYTIQNAVFEDFSGGSVIRSQGVTLTIDNCLFTGYAQTSATLYYQPVVRLDFTESVVTDSQFIDNNCQFVLYHNYNGDGSATTLTVDNCTFTENKATSTAIIYYAEGGSCEITNNQFIENEIDSTSHAATVYLGFQSNCTVTGNLFEENSANTSSTSMRTAGALFVGNNNNVSGNAFIGNTATRNGEEDGLGQVAASVYYAAIDLSDNYWGGEEPVPGVDYSVEYPSYNELVMDSYYNDYVVGDDGEVIVFNSVTGVALNKTELSLSKGGKETLVAVVTPADATNANVAWTSDNEAVATVDENGVVTAVSSGKATITVTTEDGGFTASCVVTVAAPATGDVQLVLWTSMMAISAAAAFVLMRKYAK